MSCFDFVGIYHLSGFVLLFEDLQLDGALLTNFSIIFIKKRKEKKEMVERGRNRRERRRFGTYMESHLL